MVCKERFRADKAPKATPGEPAVITAPDKGVAKEWEKVLLESLCPSVKREGKSLKGAMASESGYVCPVCGSPFLSDERAFNMMFRTFLGALDPMSEVVEVLLQNRDQPREKLLALVEEALEPSTVYLRPETAQAMFAQFMNVQQALSLKLPLPSSPGAGQPP